jgi:hypothetical protein
MFDTYSNKYARWIRAIATLVMVVGCFAGIVFWLIDTDDNIGLLLTTVCYSIVTGIFFFGFAEIIEILYRIYRRLEAVDGIKRTLENMTRPE